MLKAKIKIYFTKKFEGKLKMSPQTKTKVTPETTVGQSIYKGSYNFLTDLEMDKTVTFDTDGINNRKVYKQLVGFNNAKPFAIVTLTKKDDINYVTLKLLTTEPAKVNFNYYLKIAKTVYSAA